MMRKIKKAVNILVSSGPKSLFRQSLRKVKTSGTNKKALSLQILVDPEDVLRAAIPTKTTQSTFAKPPFRVNWVIPPLGDGFGGGHQNILRFVNFLEKAGHDCRIYSYDVRDYQSITDANTVLQQRFPEIKAKMFSPKDGFADCDAIFATGAETAYPVLNFQTKAQKFYFVQDFEPYFYPVSTDSVLAENTYKFGFYGITAGGWLADKLKREYGMQTDNYDFGADSGRYFISKKDQRKGIFFYARPVTQRRGFELGVMALELFHKKHPDYTIHFAGWDTSDYEIPFPYENHGSLRLDELNSLYNDCAAALVLSFTNMSLLPLELIAAGCIPVVNDGKNNTMVSNNPFIHYTDTFPASLASELDKIAQMNDLPGYAVKASKSVQMNSWEASGKKFVSIFERQMRG